jgi:hypothetical protein
MDIVATVIDLYFRVMESLNVRNVSVAILVLIIGIEFIEFFAEGDESENLGEGRKKRKKPDVKKLLGLGRDRNGVLIMAADEKGVGSAPEGVEGNGRQTQARRPSLKALGFASEDGAEVIGSKTYTIRTVLEGNHIYLEKVEG